MKVEEKAIEVLKQPMCDSCLGRQFGNLLSGFSNEQRGKIIRHYIAFLIDSGEKIDVDLSNFYGIKFRNVKIKPEKPKECRLCKNFFPEKIDDVAEKIVEKLKGIEFSTFQIGSMVSNDLLKAEEELWSKTDIEFVESVKSEINRELGKRIERLTKKRFDSKNPDVTVVVDLNTNKIRIEIRSLFVFGKYQKLVRGIPQAKWICLKCGGKGCTRCKGVGKMYKTSVQEIIEKPLLKATKSKKSKLSACIASNTSVLLDECSLPIGKLEPSWKTHKVLTYGKKMGVSKSKIVDFIKLDTRRLDLKTYEIITKETGRRIVSTTDHQFFTPSGMKRLSEIKPDDKLAVYPLDLQRFEMPVEKTIVSEEDIVETIEKYVPTSFRKRIILDLKNKNLLPLKTTNLKLNMIVRILAFLFGDGTVRLTKNRDVKFEFYGEKKDLNDIKSDLRSLGFRSILRKCKSQQTIVTNYYGDKKIIHNVKDYNHRLYCSYKSLWILLVTLGAPIGNKIIKEVEIPTWIMNAERSIKQNFLGSLLGTEIDKPRLDKRKYNKKSFNTPRFSVNKTEELLDNGIKFIKDIKKLLGEFGVKTLKTRLVPYATRKDGHKTIKLVLDFFSNSENLIKLYKNFVFVYAREKDKSARLAYEYLLMKKSVVDIRKKLYEIALELRGGGFTPMQIYRKIDSELIKYKDLAMWLSPKNKYHEFKFIKVPNDFPDYDKWVKTATKGLKDGLVWETVECVKKVDVPYVNDIKTEASTHTFFANGFLVSNSGREDIDARCLGWRPFVIELIKPMKRKVDLKKIEKRINKLKKVKLRGLKFTGKDLILEIKTERVDKTYLATVDFKNQIEKSKLKELKKLVKEPILQKTPLRVVHRRADKFRKRYVKSISWKLLNKKRIQFKIRAESGLYIKELINGDEGRTEPNISELIGNKVEKISLDVIKIHTKGV